MTFLAPSALWLLSLISIPLIIHFWNRFKVDEVDFSSVMFLEKLESNAIYRLKLKKILILILRVLFISSLVMMLAQPVTKGFIPGWLAGEQESSLIILIDNSASMSVINKGRTFLDISKNESFRLLSEFDDNTQIIISQTCPPKVVFTGKNNDPDIRNAIKNIEPTNGYDNLWTYFDEIISSEDIIGKIKECIVFSDFMYSPDSSFNNSLGNYDNWKFYFITPGKVSSNLGIVNVSTVDRIKTLNQLIKLDTDIKNTGYKKKQNVPIELLFNNRRVGQVISEFDPDIRKSFLFQAYPSEAGILESKMVLPSDDYLLDNNWYQIMPIMKQIRIGVIGSSLEEISLIEMVIKSIDPENTFLTINKSVQPNINRLFLNEFDMAIIHNISSITDEGVHDLERFLKKGGGVIWFQGDSSKENFHSDMYSKLAFPEQIKQINSGDGVFKTNVSNDKFDLLQDLQKRTLQKELPEVFNYIGVKLSSNHKIHWALNNNDPILLEFSIGTGNIFYFSTLLDLGWNDLPIRGMVVPLIYRLIILTGTDEINTAPVLINEPKVIAIKESDLMKKWEVLSPSGKIELIIPNYDNESIAILNTDELGIYKVLSEGEHFTSFPTRLHYKEYIKPIIDNNYIDPFLSKDQIRWININSDFSQVFSHIRNGKSLWGIFLILALIFLLGETILSVPKVENLRFKKN